MSIEFCPDVKAALQAIPLSKVKGKYRAWKKIHCIKEEAGIQEYGKSYLCSLAGEQAAQDPLILSLNKFNHCTVSFGNLYYCDSMTDPAKQQFPKG